MKKKSILYGVFAGLTLFAFYIFVVSFFQGLQFAILNFKSLWFWIIPLIFGFGTQIALYTSIKQDAMITGTVTTSGGISAGSMVACCSHFLLNIIPIVGISGLALFLVKYQTVFFSVGIVSSIFGISIMLNHKRKMKGGNHCVK